ncbi:MAG: DUF4013 domain-containing protein [Chloroflexi bacterium]|nr:DUF4013 domain-containing protein [Chloroflexota bacterium]
MDASRSFKYVFEDKDWIKKVLIGGVLNIIPVVGWAFTLGYGMRHFKKIREGQELPLPEWDDWGGDFQRGIMILVGFLGYAVPFIILGIFSSIFGAAGDDAIQRGNSGGVWMVCTGLITFVEVIYGIVLAAWSPAALLSYLKEEKLAAFFKFADIWAIIKTNSKEYITLVLMWLVAMVAASIIGTILCGVGNWFTWFIATLICMHLLAQFYNIIWGAGTPFSSTPPADNSFQIPQ